MDISKLIEDYTPPSEPFAVSLPGGEVLTFRAFGSYSEYKALKGRAAEWYASLPDPSDVGHPLAAVVPDNMDDAVAAFIIAEMAVDPPISHSDALRMTRAGPLVDYLLQAIETTSRDVARLALVRMVESKKNDLPTTRSGESS